MSPKTEITIQQTSRTPALGVAGLDHWIRRVVAELAPSTRSFTLRLVDDVEMEELNHRFRSRAETTDVLSFPGDESPEGRHLGDVVISVPRAQRQAKQTGHSLALEVRLLTLHGILHCLGYDHEVDDGGMERLELELRERWLRSV